METSVSPCHAAGQQRGVERGGVIAHRVVVAHFRGLGGGALGGLPPRA